MNHYYSHQVDTDDGDDDDEIEEDAMAGLVVPQETIVLMNAQPIDPHAAHNPNKCVLFNLLFMIE